MSLSAADDARAGIPVQRRDYPAGEEGIQLSLEAMAQKIYEGSGTAVMKSFAGNVLKQAGFPQGVFARASTFLDFVRANVTYAPDALGHEVIESAMITLCVEGAPICIPISDCDGLVVALLTLCAAAGMHVRIVRQFFGAEHQQHVLGEVEDENGDWIPLDPSTKYPAGKKASAVRETRVDPLDGRDGARYVGIGGLSVMSLEQGSWQQHDPNKGLGHPEARGDSTWYRVESKFPAAHALLPEQVTFYANEWYYKDGNGAVFKFACCSDCANKPNAAEAEIGVGKRFAAVSEGTKESFPRGDIRRGVGRGHEHGGHALHRHFDGGWHGWDGGSWVVVEAPTCAWGPALVNPPAALLAEATRQLAAAQGRPVIERLDGGTYLFASGRIYPCIGGLSGVPARPPFG